jgi:hypothetical protein
MRKFVFTLLAAAFSFFLLVHVPVVVGSALAPTPTPTPNEVSSFELFWPVSAGKTMGDSLYSLKILKEQVRGVLIFGAAQKSDYLVFLSTKRVVEAEKLLSDGKNDLATKTLDTSLSLLEKARVGWQKSKEAGVEAGPEKENISKQLTNLNTFFTFLSAKSSGDVRSIIDQNNQKVSEFLNSL